MKAKQKAALLAKIDGVVERSRERSDARERRRRYYELLKRIRNREIHNLTQAERACGEIGCPRVVNYTDTMGVSSIDIIGFSKMYFGPDESFIGIDRTKSGRHYDGDPNQMGLF